MLSVKPKTAPVLIGLLFVSLMPFQMAGATAAPQGKELYAGDEGATLEKLEHKIEKRLLREKGIQTATEIIAKLEDGPLIKAFENPKEVNIKLELAAKEVTNKVEVPIPTNEEKDKEITTESQSNKKSAAKEQEDSKQVENLKEPNETINKSAGSNPVTHSDTATDKNQDHKIKARQTLENESEPSAPDFDFNSDDLVTSLIRQRNDFIAASGIVETPRPLQAMRLNMNSGL